MGEGPRVYAYNYSYGLIITVEGILHEFHEAAVIACSGGGSEQFNGTLS